MGAGIGEEAGGCWRVVELTFWLRCCIFDAFFDAGVGFLLPQTVRGEHLGRAFFVEGVALSRHFMAQGLHF